MAMSKKPPIAANVDLRDFRFMPLDLIQLANSETWAMANGWEAKACVNLWCRAWHQVPAGSLPDNDGLLRTWAGVPDWDQVREMALRGFVKCSDGRLYHAVVCEKAAEAWARKCEAADEREAGRQRKKEWRAKKAQRKQEARDGGQDEDEPETEPGPDAGRNAEVTSMTGTGTGTGTIEKKEPSVPSGSKENSPNGLDPPQGDDALTEIPPQFKRPKAKSHAKRATRFDPESQAGEADREYARKQGFDERETDTMLASFAAHFTNGPGRTKTWVEWWGGSGAWGNWVRTQTQIAGRSPGAPAGRQAGRGRSAPTDLAAAVREVTGEGRDGSEQARGAAEPDSTRQVPRLGGDRDEGGNPRGTTPPGSP